MGALHDGHLSLVRAACARTDFVVVSVFVNPTQFAPGEDFEAYPRGIETRPRRARAPRASRSRSCPALENVRREIRHARVEPGPLAERWEGAVRPGHFAGVATVVTKLLNTVRARPRVLRREGLPAAAGRRSAWWPTSISASASSAAPPCASADGLALSSRNAYLTAAEQRARRGGAAALEARADAALAWGERDARSLEAAMRRLSSSARRCRGLDYAAVVDPETLEPLERVDRPARALVAARVGATRLIDNCALGPRST